jgi:hypothetical protein
VQTRTPSQFALEALEQRILLSADPLAASPDLPQRDSLADNGAIDISLTPDPVSVEALNQTGQTVTAQTPATEGAATALFAGMASDVLLSADALVSGGLATVPTSGNPDPVLSPTPEQSQDGLKPLPKADSDALNPAQASDQSTTSSDALTPILDQTQDEQSSPSAARAAEAQAEVATVAEAVVGESQQPASTTVSSVLPVAALRIRGRSTPTPS